MPGTNAVLVTNPQVIAERDSEFTARELAGLVGIVEQETAVRRNLSLLEEHRERSPSRTPDTGGRSVRRSSRRRGEAEADASLARHGQINSGVGTGTRKRPPLAA